MVTFFKTYRYLALGVALFFFPLVSYAVGSDNPIIIPSAPNPMNSYVYSFHYNDTNNNCNYTNCAASRTQLFMVPLSTLNATPGVNGTGPTGTWAALSGGPSSIPNGTYSITVNWAASGVYNRWYILEVIVNAPTACASMQRAASGFSGPLMIGGTLTCASVTLNSAPNIPVVQFNVLDSGNNETAFYIQGTLTLTRLR